MYAKSITGPGKKLLAITLAAAVLFWCGCRRSAQSPGAESDASAQGVTPPRPSPQTEFERDVQYVRDGQFTYILVFSRKDNGVFDRDDIDYLKANSPTETNQWIRTEGGRRVIAGTNFEFKQEHIDALRKRFNIEDYGTGKPQ